MLKWNKEKNEAGGLMQSSRLLSILLIISNSKLITAKSLAQHFEVSLRTIYRDIDKLALAGVPLVSIGGIGGGYHLMENYQIDHLFLNKQEAETVISLADSLDVMFGKNKQYNESLERGPICFLNDQNKKK